MSAGSGDNSLNAAITGLDLILPRGTRFFALGDAPLATADETGHSLHYASLYAHQFGLSMREVMGHTFLISNGFLASHAYNLALVMLHHGNDGDAALDAALRHNFKKVYAECALYRGNCLIGRALLIETIIYEQDIMRPLFAAAEGDPALAARATTVSQIMSGILGGHELGHYFERKDPAAWQDEVNKLGSGAFAALFEARQSVAGEKQAVETACDALGAWTVWREASDYAQQVPRQITRLRLCAFAFLCFGELFSLQRSAWFAADQAKEEDKAIELGSDKRTAEAFSLPRGRDTMMDDRVSSMISYFEDEAQNLGEPLFGDDPYFQLHADTAACLRTAFETFDDLTLSDPIALTGVDLHRRGLAQLMAETLHGHDKGAEHLLWRSKRFLQGGSPIDP